MPCQKVHYADSTVVLNKILIYTSSSSYNNINNILLNRYKNLFGYRAMQYGFLINNIEENWPVKYDERLSKYAHQILIRNGHELRMQKNHKLFYERFSKK